MRWENASNLCASYWHRIEHGVTSDDRSVGCDLFANGRWSVFRRVHDQWAEHESASSINNRDRAIFWDDTVSEDLEEEVVHRHPEWSPIDEQQSPGAVDRIYPFEVRCCRQWSDSADSWFESRNPDHPRIAIVEYDTSQCWTKCSYSESRRLGGVSSSPMTALSTQKRGMYIIPYLVQRNSMRNEHNDKKPLQHEVKLKTHFKGIWPPLSEKRCKTTCIFIWYFVSQKLTHSHFTTYHQMDHET